METQYRAAFLAQMAMVKEDSRAAINALVMEHAHTHGVSPHNIYRAMIDLCLDSLQTSDE